MSSFNENIMKRNKIVYLFIIVFLLPASGFARNVAGFDDRRFHR